MSTRDELARDIFIADNHRDPNAAQEWDAFRDIGGLCGGDYAQDIADRLTAKGYRKPRTITNVEELDALPEGSVVLDGDVCVRRADGYWKVLDLVGVYASRDISLPATVLHEPEAECSGAASCKAGSHIHGCFAEPTNIDFALATAAAAGVPLTEAQAREYIERGAEPEAEASR